MRLRVVRFPILIVVCSIPGILPSILCAQDSSLPPPEPNFEDFSTETEPRAKTPQEMIAEAKKRFREVRNSEREERKKHLPKWFAIEEALDKVIRLLESEDGLDSDTEVQFARVVLTTFIPDDDKDQAALQARNAALGILKRNKSARRLSPGEIHSWHELSARLARVWAANRYVVGTRVMAQARLRGGSLEEVLHSRQRLLDSKSEFVSTAFTLFPYDQRSKPARQAMQRAEQAIRSKQMERAWASALRQWVINYNLWIHNRIGLHDEFLSRQTAYEYEAQWHQSKAK
jgi:hypothetical protein